MKPAYGKTFVNATLLANIAKQSVMIGLREYAPCGVSLACSSHLSSATTSSSLSTSSISAGRHMLLRAAQGQLAVLVVCAFSLLPAARANCALSARLLQRRKRESMRHAVWWTHCQSSH